ISGNPGSGATITDGGSNNNRVAGNFIGTNAAGVVSAGFGNGTGLRISTLNNLIGGIVAGEPNVIAGNAGKGVVVTDNGIQNSIRSNSIFSNGGLGIDLGDDGVTANDVGDPDNGPNTLLNFPVITNATVGSTIIQFTYNGVANSTFRLEFFSSVTPDPTAHGEGETFLGFTDVTTDGSGNVSSTFTSPLTVPLGNVISATATDSNGDTSEFSTTRIVLATAVSFLDASAIRQDGTTVLEWRTGREVNNLGFNIYKEVAGKRSLATPEFVAGSALLASSSVEFTAGKPYVWIDKEAAADTVYWIEDIDLNGTRILHGPVVPQEGKLSERFTRASRTLADLSKSAVSSYQAQLEYPVALTRQTETRSNNTESGLSNKQTSRKGPFDSSAALAASSFRLAGQRALKIAVTRDGWYRVRASSLFAERGPGRGNYPQLFSRGEAVPIKVTGDEWIEFYGQGLDTPSTDARIYWLIWAAKPGLSIPEIPVDSSSQDGAMSFRDTVERRDRTLYFSALLNGDKENIFGPLVGSNQTTQGLTLKGIDPAQAASLEVTLQGVTNVAHSVRVQWNGVDVGVAEVVGQNNQTASFSIAGSALRLGDNTVTLQSVNGPTDLTLIERVKLTFSRRYRADNNQLRFTLAAGEGATVS
ncbi:MAG: right-handed parallel beta-helix repeat-containing protein, partial [Pyrinomonadaceae bacterium]